MRLSKRDNILLAMMALTEVDDRIAPSDRKNKINFSGTISQSENKTYLEKVYQEISDWCEDRLLEFALSTIKKSGG